MVDFWKAINTVKLLMYLECVRFLGLYSISCSLWQNAKWTGWETDRKAKEKLLCVSPFPSPEGLEALWGPESAFLLSSSPRGRLWLRPPKS